MTDWHGSEPVSHTEAYTETMYIMSCKILTGYGLANKYSVFGTKFTFFPNSFCASAHDIWGVSLMPKHGNVKT